jgi:hypothetical protein
VADREADDVRLDRIERAQIAVRGIKRDSRRAVERGRRRSAVEDAGVIIVGALAEGRLLRDLREISGC